MSSRRAQRGFTLIELMIALAISSIMVLMVTAMFSRMSGAYRSQQQITQLQISIAAAQNLIETDVKRAGFQIVDGFRVPGFGTTIRAPIQITNNNTGPDELRLFAADGAKVARVTDASNNDRIEVDSAGGFAAGDLAFLVNVDQSVVSNVVQVSGGTPTNTTIAKFVACLVRIDRIDAGPPVQIRFETNAPWGDSDILTSGGYCHPVQAAHDTERGATGTTDTMIYGVYARAYRIDPTVARAPLGVLQMSPSGGLVANDWQDLGLGFTDLQIAIRAFEEIGTRSTDDTADPDDLVQYDWYSGEDMELLTGAEFFVADHARITQMTVSLAARTDRDVDDIYTRATPAFIDTARADNNDLGDRDSVDLTATPPAELAGKRIYRYSINRIDTRNTGSGL